ncbi:MAG: hypothetical protein JWP91_3115 [Fibrobacteres bacterium]|nr:hypothetical protein [Fibrobacterota bacterium]
MGQNDAKVREHAGTVDRRVQKTKKLLSESLIALILEKGYDEVTIQDILDKANVGRSTFYSHYESKERLLFAGPQNLGIALFGGHAGTGSGPADFLPLFLHAGANLALAKAMLGRKSGTLFMGHLKGRLSESIRDAFKHRFGRTRQEKLWLAYHSAASASMVIDFLVSWLEDGMPFPAAEIAERCGEAVSAMFGGAVTAK